MSLSTFHRSDPDHHRRTPDRLSGLYAPVNQVIPDFWTVRTTVMLDVAHQRASRVSDRGEDAASNHIALDLRWDAPPETWGPSASYGPRDCRRWCGSHAGAPACRRPTAGRPRTRRSYAAAPR